VDHELFHGRHDERSVEAARERFGLPGKYILSVGTLEPRKNLSLLVESFALLRKWKIDDYRLVIAGEKGWKYDQIFRTVRDLGLEDEVRFLGYVPTEDLPLLYRGAELFVYPSLYEGFGVPILEAMACGCPVVASDRASIPEVCGAAGILVAPEDRDDVAEAMGRVLSDPSLADAMRVRGRERAEGFRWETSARALLLLYEECARS
jgi:glycosyltransferase involved in cell wall biosynthesis